MYFLVQTITIAFNDIIHVQGIKKDKLMVKS